MLDADPEVIELFEDFIFSQVEDVIVVCALDIDKVLGSRVELVKFFSIPLADHAVLIAMNDEERGID